MILYADGGTIGQNGISSTGIYWSVYDEISNKIIVNQKTDKTGTYTTNNEAEYFAFIECLTIIEKSNMNNVVIRMDSKLIVSQITGAWRVKNRGLKALFEQAHSKLKFLESDGCGCKIKVEWVPRVELLKRLNH